MTALTDTLQRRLGEALFARGRGPGRGRAEPERLRIRRARAANVRRRPPDPAGRHGDVVMFVGGLRAPLAGRAAPAGHDRGPRSTSITRNDRGQAAADSTPGGHHGRYRRRRAARCRPRAPGRPLRQGDRNRRAAVPGGRPAPAALGSRGRSRQLPALPPALRRPAARRGRVRRLRRRRGPHRDRPRSPRPAADAAGARRRAQLHQPELRATPEAIEAARFLVWTPPLPLLARGPYALLAATAVAELPAWARRQLRLPRPHLAESALVPPAGHGI